MTQTSVPSSLTQAKKRENRQVLGLPESIFGGRQPRHKCGINSKGAEKREKPMVRFLGFSLFCHAEDAPANSLLIWTSVFAGSASHRAMVAGYKATWPPNAAPWPLGAARCSPSSSKR